MPVLPPASHKARGSVGSEQVLTWPTAFLDKQNKINFSASAQDHFGILSPQSSMCSRHT